MDPKNIRLDDLLTGRLTSVEERETCLEAVRLMAARGVRRMPVIDAAGALVGIVTLDDLLPHLTARSRERELQTRK